jgi:outer membrane protein assembly factor BamA
MFRLPVFITAVLLCLFFISNYAQEQYELTEINFEGNNSLASGDLKEVIYSEETPFWLWKFLNSFTPFGSPPVYFDSSSIKIDVQSLIQYYNANGFFTSKVSPEYTIDTLDKEAVLLFKITEGEPSTYGKFTFTGLDSIQNYLVNSVHTSIIVDSSETYNQPILEQNIDASINILMNNGYMLAKFDSIIIYRDTANLKADVEIFYTTGQHFTIDSILVNNEGVGAKYVDNDDIVRITDLSPGEQFSNERVRASQERLFRTGLFNSINIRPYTQDSIHGKELNLSIDGTIGEMNELSPEIITNNQANALNVGLGATYTRKNFFGSARKFTLTGSFGLQDIFAVDYSNLLQRFSFRDTTLLGFVDARLIIEQPYLFNELIYGILEFYSTIDKQANYNNTIYGSKLTFDFELPQFTFINFLRTYYNVEVSNEVYRTNNDSLARKLISAVGTDFGKTTADNILFPTRGYNISMQVEEANLLPYILGNLIKDEFKGALFYRVLFNSAFYTSFTSERNTILAAKFKTGHLQSYLGDYAGLPINRTFYSGGSNSVRGWRVNELYPREAPSIQNEIHTFGVNYKGGTFLLESSLEFRYRFLENIGAAVFADAGNAWLSYKDFRFDETALAVGVGVRYYSAVAPFRLDFGIKFWDPDAQKWIFSQQFMPNVVFHFGIGEAF